MALLFPATLHANLVIVAGTLTIFPVGVGISACLPGREGAAEAA